MTSKLPNVSPILSSRSPNLKAAAERAKDRKEQVGSGERSDKIRTYNYKDNRVSDHRINLTLKKLDQVLDGDLDEFIDALVSDNEASRLANLDE